MRRLLIGLAFSLLSSATLAAELKPFHASYTADFKQLPFSGTAERSLSKQAGDTWQLSFQAAMMVASLKESSTLKQTNNQLVPLSYEYNRSGLGKSKKIKQSFDWSAKTVTGSEKGKAISLPLTPGLLDKSTYQLALQEDVAAGKKSMRYRVVDGDDIDTYEFRVVGSESVKTKAGRIEAIKVERVRDPNQSKRETQLWFAKDWDYLLVSLRQVEKDGKEYQIVLEQAEVSGKPVKGR